MFLLLFFRFLVRMEEKTQENSGKAFVSYLTPLAFPSSEVRLRLTGAIEVWETERAFLMGFSGVGTAYDCIHGGFSVGLGLYLCLVAWVEKNRLYEYPWFIWECRHTEPVAWHRNISSCGSSYSILHTR